MLISMEVPVFSTHRSSSGISLCPFALDRAFFVSIFSSKASGSRLTCCTSRSARRISMRLARDSSLFNGYESREVKADGDSAFVEVIVIGSRKDAIVDFCLESPFHPVLLRFWIVNMKDSGNMQLQQRFLEKDLPPKIMDSTQLIQSCPRAIILVATAGYGSDHIAAIDILNTVRSGGGLAVAIFLKPFSFEGQRRLDEVKELAAKLRQHTNFCIDVDIETLLQKDLVTLDEALKNANNAVSLAINAIPALVTEMHGKFIDVLHGSSKELKGSEVTRILENYKEAKVGFGAGHNFKTSILRAIYDCPFIRPGIQGLNAIICIVASSVLIEENDVEKILLTFRQTIEYTGEIIISTVHEPNLESKVLVTALFILSCPEQEASQKGSFFSKLSKHFPFVFNLLKRYHPQSDDNEVSNAIRHTSSPMMNYSSNSSEVESRLGVEDIPRGLGNYSGELQGVSGSHNDNIYASSESSLNEVELSDCGSCDFHGGNTEEHCAFQREPIASWKADLGYQIEHEWPQKRTANSGDSPILDSLSIISLPVGVRLSKDLKDAVNVSAQHGKAITKDNIRAEPLVNSDSILKSFDDTASAMLTEKYADVPTKQGNLSARAASMLEAERDSPKRWSPILEMQYRGGIYRGRCQGGLPEGKGRLILGDGSIYDGMWRYGKRSSLGTFYFNNGDVFQGTWRDDVIHGKGWFYFHTGDRWFANFWKGKANGEGRFYSKSGDIFFGHFKDGWRHGIFLCIDVDGTRYSETWDEGVLLTREQVDADNHQA